MKNQQPPSKPGQPAPLSGQYVPVGPRGGKADGPEITMPKGHTLPPTPEPGQRWKVSDPTDNKSGRPKE